MTRKSDSGAGNVRLLVGAEEAAALAGIGRSSWWALHSAGKCPAPVRLLRRTLWRRGELADWIAANAKGRNIIVGGDFNTPPDAGTFEPFRGMVEQATGDSGYTAVNEFPMARIDQVWQAGFEEAGSMAFRTQNSDHRMVRCWLIPSSQARAIQ